MENLEQKIHKGKVVDDFMSELNGILTDAVGGDIEPLAAVMEMLHDRGLGLSARERQDVSQP